MICPIEQSLNAHLNSLDKKDERQEAIESVATDMYDKLISGQIIFIGNDNYSLDDFAADFDIDVCYLARCILGDADDFIDHAKESLNEYAEELAVKLIDSRG